METTVLPSEMCSIARTVAIVGDRWTLLVLRDITNGVRRFADLADHLGVARDVLSRRLAGLVDDGILERVPYREPGARERHEYRLTGKGRDLTVVLLALMAWGDRHLGWPDGPPLRLEHRDCGAPVSVGLRCTAGHEVSPDRGLRLQPRRWLSRAAVVRPDDARGRAARRG